MLAGERKVGFMGNLVAFESLLVGKAFRTFLALERPSLLMELAVLLQFVIGQERTLAVHAQIFRHVFVNLYRNNNKYFNLPKVM